MREIFFIADFLSWNKVSEEVREDEKKKKKIKSSAEDNWDMSRVDLYSEDDTCREKAFLVSANSVIAMACGEIKFRWFRKVCDW